MDLTAELSPIAGLPGFQTCRITATSDLGNIVGFDFTSSGGYGVTGAMNQLDPRGDRRSTRTRCLQGPIRLKIRISFTILAT